MLTPTAAATWSGVLLPEPFFWELEADGVAGAELESVPRFEPPSELAKSRWSPTSWLTVRLLLSGLVRELSLSPGVPVAEAVASALVLEEPVAWTVIAPPALIDRPTDAATLWMATVTAIAKPSALLAALAEPFASVSALAAWVAETIRKPAGAVTPPSSWPSRAVVLISETATATTGVIAVPLGPVVAAPFSAFVTIWCPPEATIIRLLETRFTPSLTMARVSSMTMLSASERPRPKLAAVAPVPDLAGSAWTVEALEEVALRLAAPVS